MSPTQVLSLLREYESRNVTHIERDGSWPIVWKRANGVHVWDANGKRFLDLTAAFGVAAAGHANPRVVKAAQKQLTKLSHAMGDVHPHELKARLVRELSRVTFERWRAGQGKTILGNSGFEAVEAALKTAMLATKRNHVVAFEEGYHGLGYGTLNVTHRGHFRDPFRNQLREFGHFFPFPKSPEDLPRIESKLRKLLQQKTVGAILVEPIQVRGGINVPPLGFLKLLRKLANDYGVVLIFDEIYTGFGRTGKWFACEHEAVAPDVTCLGKALTGGFPLSACVGRSALMDKAWPNSTGEAIHTSTFLGNPVGCAMALAQIEEIRKHDLPKSSAATGKVLWDLLNKSLTVESGLEVFVRGRGLLVGVELRTAKGLPAGSIAIRIIKNLLRRGFIFLPEGEHGNVIGFTPPLTITVAQIRAAVRALNEELVRVASPR